MEVRRLSALFEQQRARLSRVPEQAVALVTAPAAKPATETVGKAADPSSEAAEAAAWTVVARVLLNLDETITRE